ncbi:short-chain dehydrogenase [Lophiotrema nucula]|uniref:Short-chain dehydrogenase n=1 Tax=Lophiotrema nucula TaxID=690887 RepID=A0A6A5Z5P2_9PLEO|nr:short-chain dehydrogenase [Lophiotrema nucula]
MSTLSQMFPPSPTFTEKNLVDLSSKVYIVTGATAGVGLELAKILYSLHATVYIGGRSLSRCQEAANAIKTADPSSKGTIKPFVADLANLATVKGAVAEFLKAEHRLDVLFLNAGVMQPPDGSKTKDGYDLEMGVNCLSNFLFVKLLTPIMEATSSHFCHPNPSVRVVWVASCLDIGTPQGGVQFPSTVAADPSCKPPMAQYMQTKAGIYFLAHEFFQRSETVASVANPSMTNSNRVMHVSLHPGFMRTELQRHMPAAARAVMSVTTKGPKYGAYTELYGGLAPQTENGAFYWPWGRKGEVPEHLIASTKKGENSQSVSEKFYDWCEEQVKSFM